MMKIYEIDLEFSHMETVYIKAESAEEAKEFARQFLYSAFLKKDTVWEFGSSEIHVQDEMDEEDCEVEYFSQEQLERNYAQTYP
jgi:hypothetical protein